MKLTSQEAMRILENARPNFENQNWIEHSICVGNAAGRIANALNEKGYNLDIDKAITLGYVHDIGKMVGDFKDHVMNGYEYMKKNGYDEEYCNICLTHSYLNNDYLCTAGGIPKDIPFRTEFVKSHKYTIYEKIINLCDLMCTAQIITIDKRLIDLIIRKGTGTNTQYHVTESYKLKEYFDNILGYNLYKLFPEVKENI